MAQILANKAPANVADLAALALDVLDTIKNEIQGESGAGVREFWNADPRSSPTNPRPENTCRNTLLRYMRPFFRAQGINCEPEVYHRKDTRADISLLCHAKFELPIEIKCDSNKELWRELREKLIDQYTISPRADGHGIYLVLWFGGKNLPNDNVLGRKKPSSPEELKACLEAQLSPSERKRIFIRVLDVSWQGKK